MAEYQIQGARAAKLLCALLKEHPDEITQIGPLDDYGGAYFIRANGDLMMERYRDGAEIDRLREEAEAADNMFIHYGFDKGTLAQRVDEICSANIDAGELASRLLRTEAQEAKLQAVVEAAHVFDLPGPTRGYWIRKHVLDALRDTPQQDRR